MCVVEENRQKDESYRTRVRIAVPPLARWAGCAGSYLVRTIQLATLALLYMAATVRYVRVDVYLDSSARRHQSWNIYNTYRSFST